MFKGRRHAMGYARVSVVLALAVLMQISPTDLVPQTVAAASTAPIITTVAGIGTYAAFPDGTAATSASLSYVTSVAPTPDGGYLISGQGAHCIWKVANTAPFPVTRVAGNCNPAAPGYAGDGSIATDSAVRLNAPGGIVALPGGDGFLFSDTGNQCVRKVAPTTHVITTVAGQCTQVGSTGDGIPATSAKLNQPIGLALIGASGFLIADYSNGCVRQVDTTDGTGTITTLVGQCGTLGYTGEGYGTAVLTGGPASVAVMPDGSFLFTDYYANRVRRADAPDQQNRRMTHTVAGSGPATVFTGFGTGGYDPNDEGVQATSAHLNGPSGVALTGGGGYVIADSENNRVRYVVPTPSGTIITTVAGTGPTGYLNGASNYDNDNVPGDTAKIARPLGIAQRADGSIIFADQLNRRIRSLATAPATNTAPPTITGTLQTGNQLTCNTGTWSGSPAFAIQWLRNDATYAGATGATILLAQADAGADFICQVTAITAGGTTTVASAAVHIGANVTLTLAAAPHGAIGVLGSSMVCPPTCSGQFNTGRVSQLLAIPDDGYALDAWTGSCDPNLLPDCFVTLNTNTQISATFVPQQTLTVTISGPGSVGNGLDITCGGASCPFKVDPGDAQFLVATPSPGYGVMGWTGCTDLLPDGTCAVVMNGDQTVTVAFGPLSSVPAPRGSGGPQAQNPAPAPPPRSAPGQQSLAPTPAPAPTPRSDTVQPSVLSVASVPPTMTPVTSAKAAPQATIVAATPTPQPPASAPQVASRAAANTAKVDIIVHGAGGRGGSLVDVLAGDGPACSPLPEIDTTICHFHVEAGPGQAFFKWTTQLQVWRTSGCTRTNIYNTCYFNASADSTVTLTVDYVPRPFVTVSASGNPSGAPNGTIVSLGGTYPTIACTGSGGLILPGTGICSAYFAARRVVRITGSNLTNDQTTWSWDRCEFQTGRTGEYCVLSPIGPDGMPMGHSIGANFHFAGGG